MNDNDTLKARRQRLQSMRAKHKRTIEQQSTDEEARNSAGFNSNPTPRSGGSGQHMIAKRLLDFLTSTEPGAPVIPGTPVNRERLVQMVKVIKRKSSEKGVSTGRFQQILDRLGPAESLDKLNPAIVNKLVKMLAAKAGVPAPTAVSAQGGADESRLQRIEKSLEDLQHVIGDLADRLSDTQRRAQTSETAPGDSNDDDQWLNDIIQRM